MIRLVLAIALLTGLCVPAQAADAPVAPAIKQNVVVSSELVRIGDLVENAGAAAQVAIFRAPDLGLTGSIGVQRVIEAVRAHGVIAVDSRGFSEISVTRASRSIGLREIEAKIAAILSEQFRLGDARRIGVTFDREITALQTAPEQAADLVATRVSFDPRSGRFDVTFDLPATGSYRRGTLRYTGIAAEMQDVAVLARAVARGEVLRKGDIAVERRPKAEVTGDSVTDPESVIGLSARQPLRNGQMLRRADLAKPELVQRNEPVMLVFEAPGLSLTLRGTALDSGTEGDLVHVVNPQSKRQVQGIVTGPGRVTVSSLKPQAAARHGAPQQVAAQFVNPNRPVGSRRSQ